MATPRPCGRLSGLPQGCAARRGAGREGVAGAGALADHGVGDVEVGGHPTVWAEMKRQHPHIPELHALFSALPEALTW